jgi:hypothetical protein
MDVPPCEKKLEKTDNNAELREGLLGSLQNKKQRREVPPTIVRNNREWVGPLSESWAARKTTPTSHGTERRNPNCHRLVTAK